MSIKHYTREQITDCISRHHVEPDQRIRLLFANEKLTPANFEQACALYAPLLGTRFDSVLVVERLGFTHDRLLPMISDSVIKTPLGEVPVNDALRNEFCDEEDDFYIDDVGNNENMSIYDQLMLLQCVLPDLNVVSVQIAEERPSIIRELAYTITELLLERNVLVVLCSDISNCTSDDISRIRQMVRDDEMSALMNFCNSGASGMIGPGPFLAGILAAKSWELEFKVPDLGTPENGLPFLGGYAKLQSYEKR
ncbi:MAG: AmmeMemoRadiSam system protein B [Balneolaceae bacterium]|nr:MAG: AmmeMemoRadiSam system protein B [Balneolaceae bacterium]